MDVSRDQAPLRLAYRVQVQGRTQTAVLAASTTPDGNPIEEHSLKRLLPRLHPLDAAIAREIASGTVFGQLADPQLARLLPLLAQRQTRLGGGLLTIVEPGLVPRLDVQRQHSGALRLTLWLAQRDGSRVDLWQGRLIVGPQAFFIRDDTVASVESPAPWELASWAKSGVLELGAELGPARRDELVRGLGKAGVPPADLLLLAVRRAPPDRYVATVTGRESDSGLLAELQLEAQYAGERVPLAGRDPAAFYVVPGGDTAIGLIERDLDAERQARHVVSSAGFRWDNSAGAFVAKAEAALRALDPASAFLPPDWVVERLGVQPRFRHGLDVQAEVKLHQDRNLLELHVGLTVADDEAAAVRALIEMKDLLAWLEAGVNYIRLADGSFAAPSPRLRQSLRILSDLGADADRVLVSPLCVGLLKAMGDRSRVAAADELTRAWLDEVSGDSRPRETEPPPRLAGVLRDYQHRGHDWLAMLHRYHLTGILADDMGLGKTLQALALLSSVRKGEGAKPSLVVAPTSVLSVWRDEASRFTPELKVVLWQGPPAERRQMTVADCDLIVTSYGILRRDIEQLATIGFRYVILDEAQSAKNAATQNARAVRRLKSERRLALTGTPIENRPEELWATFDFLAPGFLGSLRAFRRRYARPIDRGESEPLALLKARVHPLVLRRLKTEVAQELPEKIESVVRCEMEPAQRALYEHIAGELKETVRQKIESVGIERAHMAVLAALMRLRQICCDPSLLPVPSTVKAPPSAKLDLFEELLREALESDRRVVVFSQFVEMQKRLITVIRGLGVEPLWLHGGTRRRDKVIAAFQDPAGPPIIVVSLKAGGTGVTLTRADTVMHYDPWWNPAVERQATDRTHRLGQEQQVTVYKLICARSIEERVLEMAARKDALAERLLGSEGTAAKRITVDEVMRLLE